jgi:hypothetical protein
MPETTLNRLASRAACQTVWGSLLLGSAMFVLLWILNTPFRQVYVPNDQDISVLADGLLLAPDAHWSD